MIRRYIIAAIVAAFAATPIAAELCVTACLPRAEAAAMPSCHDAGSSQNADVAAGGAAFTTAGDCQGHVSVDTVVQAKAIAFAPGLASISASMPPRVNRVESAPVPVVIHPPGGPPPGRRLPLRI